MIVCGIDPGITECAYAIIEVHGQKMSLIDAVLVKNTYKSKGRISRKDKIAQMARDFQKSISTVKTPIDVVCVELTTAVLNHDTLARMAFASGYAAGSANGQEMMVVSPPTWKDVSDKEKNHNIMFSRMSVHFKESLDSFLKPVANGKRHNVIDAVGIAIWASKQ